MNFLGKMLTVMILVMSIVFMTFSVMVFATHKNWRLAALNPKATEKMELGLKPQLEQARQENAALKAEMLQFLSQFEAERAARAYALAGLQTKLTQLEQQITQKEADLQTMQSRSTAEMATLQTSVSNLDKLTKEVEGLRGDIIAARLDRDKKFAEVVAATDVLNKVLDDVRRLEERRVQLIAMNAEQKRVMDVLNVTVNTNVDGIAPKVDGMVLAVNKDAVEISLGADDGLKAGHQMEVIRGTTYLGRVQIVKVTPNRAIGKILPEYRRGIIKKDDRVTTRLS